MYVQLRSAIKTTFVGPDSGLNSRTSLNFDYGA